MQQQPQNHENVIEEGEIVDERPEKIVGEAELIEEDEKFRINRRSIGLTYSKTELEKTDVSDFFTLGKFSPRARPIVIIVTKEWHQDRKHHHLHVYLEWADKIDIKNVHAFDIPDEEETINHPNIRRIYNKAGWISYITKEDKNPLVLGMQLAEFWKSKTSQRALLCKDLINEEISIWEALQQNPQILWDLGKIQQNLTMALAIKKLNKMPEYKPTEKGKEKLRHWWLYGESNTGKTTFVRNLQEANPDWWFQIPTNNDWVGYAGQPFLYLDEFYGQLTVQELNKIADGGSKVNIKMSGTTICRWPVIIIISNFDIRETYKNVPITTIVALKNRFREIMAVKESGAWMTDMVNFFSFHK